MFDICYWWCFIFLVIQILIYFFKMLERGFQGCKGKKQTYYIFGISVLKVLTWIGIIYYFAIMR